ncbi:hypothetical protein Nepgr_018463 [Nepenthes gracilis]|uniref:Uncharacterized protein n=1 Tax=Nepenthes gracilis TaxID=150966 RepID=A0AAD3SU25_NEPGR|nr:hypothetical protein Nepgr_018463 [Nepenthes gracilis]
MSIILKVFLGALRSSHVSGLFFNVVVHSPSRRSSDSRWKSCMTTTDFEWKKKAKPVMELYSEATDGAMVWNHQAADPVLGSRLAKELPDHLENVLANRSR